MTRPPEIEKDLQQIRQTALFYLEEAGLQKETRPHMLSQGGMMEKARNLVRDKFYFQYNIDKNLDEYVIPLDDVFVVWFSKTLQNWKCLISTNIADDAYYEVTYNGDKQEAYVDQYIKRANFRVPD